jgi:hypothetical protein
MALAVAEPSGCVIKVLRDQHLREQSRSRHTLVDEVRWHRRLHQPLTTSADPLAVDMPLDLEHAGGVIEFFTDIFADAFRGAAAAAMSVLGSWETSRRGNDAGSATRRGMSGYTPAMNRSEFEQWLQDFYKARLSNDVERCMTFFTPHSTFRLAGSTKESSIARARDSLAEMRDQVTELVRVCSWKDMEIYNRVIDGETAAIRYELTTVFNPLGELITTEIVDVVTVSERKVVEFHQFVDTAAIERLVARAHAAR